MSALASDSGLALVLDSGLALVSDSGLALVSEFGLSMMSDLGMALSSDLGWDCSTAFLSSLLLWETMWVSQLSAIRLVIEWVFLRVQG